MSSGCSPLYPSGHQKFGDLDRETLPELLLDMPRPEGLSVTVAGKDGGQPPSVAESSGQAVLGVAGGPSSPHRTAHDLENPVMPRDCAALRRFPVFPGGKPKCFPRVR